MPSSIAVNYLGDAQIEATLRSRVQKFMESYGGRWTIQITGSERNPIWEMTIKGPDGKRRWINKLYGQDKDHAIDKILADIKTIAKQAGFTGR